MKRIYLAGKKFASAALTASLAMTIWSGVVPLSGAERSGDQGYGLLIGRPSGFSAKLWLNDYWTIDGAIGVASGELAFHGDILYHVFNWTEGQGSDSLDRITKNGALPFYVGIGPRVIFRDDEEIGIRFPVGLSYLPFGSDWEIFGEIAPVLRLEPDTGFNGDYGVGVRYYFRTIRPRSAPKY